MSLLGALLKAKDPLLEIAITQLEEVSGREGLDTALIGEILAKAYERAGQMGLDPDFNAKELYHSLINRVKADDARLAEKLGGQDPDDVAEMLPLIVKAVNKADLPKSGWFMKEAVAHRMLKEQPPPNIMKRLGYSDATAMLDRENLFELYCALRFAEEAEWLNQFNARYKKLKFKDFENRQVQIINYDAEKWGDIAEHFIQKKLHNITHLKELGVVCTMPMSIKKMPGITLKVLPLLIHYMYEVHLYSAFFKLISVKKNFGELLSETLIADTATVATVAKQRVHWRVIQRYYGKLKNEKHKEIFEPHVQPEDLHWRKAEEVLYQIDPKLNFWEDMDYVGLDVDGQTVTFNLMDVALSYSNGIKFADRYLYHFREALWNEIFQRYMGQKVLEQQILEQLDNDLISPEKIKLPK
jgi:hypothetical protein